MFFLLSQVKNCLLKLKMSKLAKVIENWLMKVLKWEISYIFMKTNKKEMWIHYSQWHQQIKDLNTPHEVKHD